MSREDPAAEQPQGWDPPAEDGAGGRGTGVGPGTHGDAGVPGFGPDVQAVSPTHEQTGWNVAPEWRRPGEWAGQPEWGVRPVWESGPGQQQWGTPHSPSEGPPSGRQTYSRGPYGQPRYVAPPKPGIVPLRPLMFGEILDGSFQTIRRNAKAMLGAAILAQSLAAVLAAVITAVTATSLVSFEAWAESAGPADAISLGLGFLAAVLLVVVLTVFISAVLQGAMVVPVARSILNRPTGFRQMWGLARSRAGALIRLAALMIMGVMLGFLVVAAVAVGLVAGMEGTGALLLIPFVPAFIAVVVWIYIKLMLAPAAVVIEELGAIDGLRRSWALTRANWWRVFGITVVVGIVVGIIGQVVMIPVTLLPTVLGAFISPHGGTGQEVAIAIAVGLATAVLGAVIGAVGYAFQTSVMALIYMDLRMRKDGLDIALLRMLETGDDPDGIPGRGMTAAGPGTIPGTNPGTNAGGAWPDVS